MENVSNKTNPVLLVVDVQVGVMRNAWNSQPVIENIAKVVQKARSAQTPVLWVQHTDDELVHGSPDWELVPELIPAAGEIKIDKSYNSAFEQTTLQETLKSINSKHIFLAGAASNWCIRATAFGALERGYKLTLISDAHTTESLEFDDGTIIEARDIIRELNASIKWLDYPGSPNSIIKTDEVVFNP